MNQYVAATTLPVSCEQAFAYHERPGALGRLIPPWQTVTVESSDGSLLPGSHVTLKTRIGPIKVRWIAEHTEYAPPHLFVDKQLSGPFAKWLHRHHFLTAANADAAEGVTVPASIDTDADEGSNCVLRDDIEYALPWRPFGQIFGGWMARKEVETMFAYRHRVTRDDLQLSVRCPSDPMTIAISGPSGLVGSKLCSMLTLLGHRVIRLERSIEKATQANELSIDSSVPTAVAPWSSADEVAKLDGIDAVVHLAGKSIASGRWSDRVKKEIRDSRVELTGQLAHSLASLPRPPKVFVCASAIGIYGDRGDETLTETSSLADDFLADVGRQWEAACEPASQAGIRVANARFGIVLDPSGGALQKMLLPAKFMGGKVGNGKQWWSWVALDDCLGAIYHAICHQDVQGPFNVTAPEPMQNRDFAKVLGRVISRPALFPAPAFGLRLALGEMADALLLSSTRVMPEMLTSTGYEFRFNKAEAVLRYCLGKDRLESIS